MPVGLGLLLDLTSRLPRGGASTAAAHSHAGLSAAATVAATAAAAFATSGVPLSARHLYGSVLFPPLPPRFIGASAFSRCDPIPGFTVAHCDAGTAAGWNEASDLINELNTQIRDKIQQARTDYIQYPTKEYPSELKPLFSAFGLKNFTITTLRSFLLYYLPLVQPNPHTDSDDDEDLLPEAHEEKPVDLVTPFKNSVKQIVREATHSLGVAAAWVVQSIIEVYRCFIRKPTKEDEPLPSDDDVQFDDADKFRMFGRKIYGITIKSCFSLVLASVGAGVGALVHPVHGQWFGCALGDVAGPVIAIIVFERMQLPL
nr:unnamed protein product [Digitaria exilis]